MATRLRIKNIIVETAKARRVFNFDYPLTALIGPVGTGKSSLLMLLKHALGGRASLTPAVRENVKHVIVDLQVEDVRLEPANLRPILHAQHPPDLARGSTFTRRS